MKSSARQTSKLLKEYAALAATYDQQWSGYLDASLGMTLEVAGDLPAGPILDVGCGTGRLLEVLAEGPDSPALFGIDSVPGMLDVARARIGHRASLLRSDATKLPFKDASFQLVISTNALHYFADSDAALRGMRRVTAASGHLVITDWCRDYFWMAVLNRILPWTRHAHVHTFSSSELEQSLTRAGFRVIAIRKRKIDWFWGLMTVHATAA